MSSPRPASARQVLLVGGATLLAAPAITALALLDRDASFAALRRWARWFLDCFGVEVRVEDASAPLEAAGTGQDARSAFGGPGAPTGRVFVLLDQTSLLDGPVGVAALPGPFRAIINLEFLLLPGLGWMTAAFGIPIIRQWPAQARRALERAQTHLERGGDIWISIEGRRSKDGRPGAFKKGPVVLAIAAQAAIVPVWIEGSHAALAFGYLRPRPGQVTVRVLPRIETRGLRYEDRHAVVALLQRLADEQQPPPSPPS
ncbi:MAG TPA: lysophospholipid acyltransferase family protein [Kofleriaceae bacterium]|nr:lysophospholipid acyltransferase family protein [Kofleriaceae bacterium]